MKLGYSKYLAYSPILIECNLTFNVIASAYVFSLFKYPSEIKVKLSAFSKSSKLYWFNSFTSKSSNSSFINEATYFVNKTLS